MFGKISRQSRRVTAYAIRLWPVAPASIGKETWMGGTYTWAISIGSTSTSLRTGSNVLDGLSLAIGLRGKVAHRVISIALGLPRKKRRLRHSPEGVVAERGQVPIGVGDRGQVVLAVVGILGGVLRRVGHRREPVSVIVNVVGRLAVLRSVQASLSLITAASDEVQVASTVIAL
jgi:hypothetical protein